MLMHGEANFVLAPKLYLLDCPRRQNIRPSCPYVSPRTQLSSIGVPRRPLGARKNSVGRTGIRIMKRPFGVRRPMPLFSNVYSRLALGALLSSKRWKKPIHSLELFFAAAVWLVLPKRTTTLK